MLAQSATGFDADEDYEFKGWSKTAGGEVEYSAGNGIKIAASDVDLYAVWEKIPEYPVAYHSAYPTDTGLANTSKHDGEYKAGVKYTVLALSDTGFDAGEDYEFKGWAETAGGAVKYTAGNTFDIPAKATNLYAVWEKIPEYTVTYHSNYPTDTGLTDADYDGGSYKTDETHKVLDLSTTGFDAGEDYEFKGWSTTAGGEVEYTDKNEIKIATSDIDLYAVWEKIPEYPVTYHSAYPTDAGLGNITFEGGDYKADEIHTVLTQSATGFDAGEDYEFKGWAISELNAGLGIVAYAPGAELKVTEDGADLYAIWAAVKGDIEEPEFPVIYHANYPTDSGKSETSFNGGSYKKDTDYKVLSDKDTAFNAGKDYEFKGWATSALDAGLGKVTYKAGDGIKIPEGTTDLYAVWTAVKGDNVSPKTGDGSSTLLMTAIAAASALAAGAVTVSLAKARKKEDENK